MKAWQQTLLLGAGFGVAFLLGQRLPVGAAGGAEFHGGAMPLFAQGRGPVNPPPADPKPQPNGEVAEPSVIYSEESGQTSSANGFLAVTGSYGVGTSVLYLIDTDKRQLAVYEARGGSTEQRRVTLVGARRIDLDLQLEGYNDRSEYDYDRLKDVFQKRGRTGTEAQSGLEPGLPARK